MRRLTRWGASLGCVGCLGLAAGGVLLAVTAVVVAGVVVQSQWEKALRWAMEAPTGGEVDFEDLRLGLGKVTLVGVVVSSPSGHEVLRVDELIARGDPWAFTRERLALDGAELQGVRLSLHREDGPWELPHTTLALLGGETPEDLDLPEVAIPVLVLTDVTAVISAPEASFTAHLDRVSVPAVTATMEPGLRALVGPLAVEGLSLSAPGGETLTVARASLETDALALPLTALPARDVRLEEVRAEVASSGWTLPAAALGALVGGEGLDWPAVAATDLTVTDVRLEASAPGGGAVVGVAEATLPTLDLDEALSLELGPVDAVGFSLATAAGQPIARAPWARVQVAPWTPGDASLSVPAVSTGNAWVHARWGSADLGIPRATWSLARVDGMEWGGVRVGRVDVDGAEVQVAGREGTLDLAVDDLWAEGIVAGRGGEPPWTVSMARLGPTTVSSGGEEVATIASLALGRGGTVTASGARVWTVATSEHTLTFPPVVADHVPTWLGGHNARSGDPWFGVDFAGLPWRPQRLVATGTTLHLRDQALADPPFDWEIGVSKLSVGPRRGDRVPIAASATLAEGEIEVDGHLTADNRVVADIEAKKLKVKKFRRYIAPTLRTYGMAVEKGAVAGEVRLRLTGSDLRIKGEAHLRRLQLRGTSGAGEVLASAANRMGNITVPVTIRGDLSDPGFSPVRSAIEGIVQGGVRSAKGAGSRAVEAGASKATGGRSTREARDEARGKAGDAADQARETLDDIGSSLGIGTKKKKRNR